jgi:hypothetical protein
MKKLFQLILFQTFIIALPISAQIQTDSLIRFTDLKYHSDFEKEAVLSFVKNKSDTFNLFLAIDETMSEDEAKWRKKIYLSIFDDLNQKNIDSKKINKKIKLSYSNVHSRFLKKYNDNDYFPVIFQTGTYNCVSASMLYAMVFDELEIPYKVKASSNHVYLVANPGSNSIVIETTNPGFEKAIFTGEFKQQYVNYLRTSKLISEEDYKNKSVEEIFEEKFKEVRDAEFINLPGFQYYNKALTKLQNNDVEEALILSQKAYFFYPDNQVKTLLYTALLFQIEKCNFDRVSDIDYLAQLSRFENTDLDAAIGIFNNIIYHQLQYTDKEAFCDSLYQRLISQITDKKLIEEVSFTYNMQMSYRYQNSDNVEKYVAKALEIKGNHHDANVIMENHLRRKLFSISNSYALLDTINQLEIKYNYEMITPLLKEYKLMAYLRIASDQFEQRKIIAGDKYLQEFENNCTPPIKNQWLSTMIENTYRSAAVYYFYKGNKSKAKSYVNRGLKYVPNSRLLESAVY